MDVKQLKSFPGDSRDLIGKGTPLGGGVSDAQQKLGHRITLGIR